VVVAVVEIMAVAVELVALEQMLSVHHRVVVVLPNHLLLELQAQITLSPSVLVE
jgi:hypothetical protein